MRKIFESRRCADRRVLHGEEAYASKVRVLIERTLPQDLPTVACLAAATGDSRRTMQRRLAAEGTNFSTLLEDVRRERAMKELTSSTKQVGLIAAELGFSGRPAFSRAVRRWFGLSPREVRMQIP